MRVSALLVPFLVLASSFGVMAGCGGGHSSDDCAEKLTDNGEDNSVYDGKYTLTFTPRDGADSTNRIVANVEVYDAGVGNGNVRGGVVDAGAASGTTPLGSDSVVAKGRCDGGRTYIRLKFRRSVSPDPEQINVTTDTLDTLAGASVPATLSTSVNGGDDVPGTLAISSATASL